jgi:hypothetical protein
VQQYTRVLIDTWWCTVELRVFPPRRPPDRVLDFIIGIEDNHGLMDVEMPWLCRVHDREFQEWRVQSECDEKMIKWYGSLLSQYCRVSFVFSHGLKPVGFCHKLVCQAIVPLAVSFSSSESFHVAPNYFLHLISLAHHQCCNAFPSHQKILL